jgi:hypothetical protein
MTWTACPSSSEPSAAIPVSALNAPSVTKYRGFCRTLPWWSTWRCMPCEAGTGMWESASARGPWRRTPAPAKGPDPPLLPRAGRWSGPSQPRATSPWPWLRGARGTRTPSACANAEAVLRLVGRLVQDRTEAQWRVVDALRAKSRATTERGPGRHGLQKQVARDLGISEQSVSRAVLRSGWQEEWAARPAAEMLLATAHRLVLGNLTPEAQDGDDNRGEP